jgi:hypothetical protein
MTPNEQFFNNPELREGIRDFVLKMLGAPLVKLELDDQQVALCIDRTCELMASSKNVEAFSAGRKKMIVQDGALALAKMMLGRARTKFGVQGTGTKGVKSKPQTSLSASVMFPVDGNTLLAEGERQYEDWKRLVF